MSATISLPDVNKAQVRPSDQRVAEDEPLSEHDDWIQRATFPEMYESRSQDEAEGIAELDAR